MPVSFLWHGIGLIADGEDPRCPRCGRRFGSLPVQARYCPDCGERMRRRTGLIRGSALGLIGAAAWTLGFTLKPAHKVLASSSLPIPGRQSILSGYSMAMYRLGWRYESSHSFGQNLPEAMRCYRKSASLGNTEAAHRLSARGEPLPVLALSAQDDTQT